MVPVGLVLSTTTLDEVRAVGGAVLEAASATEFWLRVSETDWPSEHPLTGIV